MSLTGTKPFEEMTLEEMNALVRQARDRVKAERAVRRHEQAIRERARARRLRIRRHRDAFRVYSMRSGKLILDGVTIDEVETWLSTRSQGAQR